MRFLIILLSLFAALFGLITPLLQKLFIDRLMGLSDNITGGFFDSISSPMLIVAAFLCWLWVAAATTLATWVASKEGVHLQAVLGEMLYGKMLRMRSDQLGHRPVGEIVALYATDVPGCTQILEQSLPMTASTIFPLIFAPIAVHWIAGIQLWATIIVAGIVILINIVLARKQSRYFLNFKQLAAERTGIVNEWVQNMRLLRILGWTESFEKKIKAKRVEETVNRVRMVTNGQMMSSVGSTVSFFINITGVASLVYLQKTAIRPGEIFALLWIFGVFLQRPFRQIPWMFTMGLDAITSIRRVEIFLAGKDEGQAATAREPRKRIDSGNAAVEVKGLRLGINGIKLLKGIDFEVGEGEWVALVGEVGSGKSLVLLSLMGETGAEFDGYKVGGHDVLRWSVDDRRMLYSFVPQEGFVMSATLRENVALEYGHSKDNDGRIKEALRLAQFDIEAERIPHGLEEEIGERGVNLSGGQRQRVSLGRAEYFTRPVLLLDDCLSAVDTDTENRLIRSLLQGRWDGRTRLLVTHRLTVLKHVDRVIFLEDGAIEATGSFEQLMKSNEKFKAFAASVAEKEKAEAKAAATTPPVSTEPVPALVEDLSAEG